MKYVESDVIRLVPLHPHWPLPSHPHTLTPSHPHTDCEETLLPFCQTTDNPASRLQESRDHAGHFREWDQDLPGMADHPSLMSNSEEPNISPLL